MKRLQPLALAGLMLALISSSAAWGSESRVVFSHLADVDPELEGWGITPGSADTGISRSAVGTGIGDDLRAWRIQDAGSSSWRYERTPHASDLAQAAQLGWVIRAVVRMPVAGDALDPAAIVELNDGVRRWAIDWGSDANGDALVGIFGFPTVYLIPGATYHTYELRHDPGTNTVDLYVDDVLFESGNPGISAGSVAVRFNFGSGFGSGTATADYHRVEWIIHADTDVDQIGDPFDNCPFVHNNPNIDTGGIGLGSAPDGIGDACQCGDLNRNGVIDPGDISRYRTYLADPEGMALTPEEDLLCAVNADPFACDLLSVVVLNRMLLGDIPPESLQSCAAVLRRGSICGDTLCRLDEGCSAQSGCQVDCGKCRLGSACETDADCASEICTAGTCSAPPPAGAGLPPRCGDGVCNGGELCAASSLSGCPEDCGSCPDFAYCYEDADCAPQSRCKDAGRCTLSGALCVVDADCSDQSGKPDDRCDQSAFGASYYEGFDGICSDGVTSCETGFFLLGNAFNTEGCPGDHQCAERRICHAAVNECTGPASNVKCCGSQPEFDFKCDNSYSCLLDDECKSGICYNFLNPGPAGICVARRAPDGSPCLESSDCAGGICNFGVCRSSLLANGQPCTTDVACASGLCVITCQSVSCGDGTCGFFSEHCGVSPRSGDSVACAADCGLCPVPSTCSVDADCESGFCDLDYLGPGSPACRPCWEADDGRCANGERCQTDGDCQVNNCISGYCAPPPEPCSGSDRPDGCQCTDDGQCSSGLCVSIPGEPDVCATCNGTLPGGACFSSSECCDFPGVDISCKSFICQP